MKTNEWIELLIAAAEYDERKRLVLDTITVVVVVGLGVVVCLLLRMAIYGG